MTTATEGLDSIHKCAKRSYSTEGKKKNNNNKKLLTTIFLRLSHFSNNFSTQV